MQLRVVSCVDAVVLATITCNDGETYIAVFTKTASYAHEQSYKILSGTTVLKESAPFGADEERTDEYCVPASTNNQYTFRMIDSYGDSWTPGSWCRIFGVYGNAVFRNYMSLDREEDFVISLYYPVMKSVEWKTTSTASIPADWNTVGFSESGWSTVTLGSTTTATGTQYYRKQFTGIADMAAYEFELNYRFGIVAYVNGVEIFRDNMPAGAVTPATLPTGNYPAYGYHGVIRPGFDVTVSSNNVLAVELHFPSGENDVDFNAYVAANAASTAVTDTDKCFIYPYNVDPASTQGMDVSNILDFDMDSAYSLSKSELPATINYQMSGPRAVINGVRVWPSGEPTSAMKAFTWEGSMGGSSWSSVFSVTNAVFQMSQYQTFYSLFSNEAYASYRLRVTDAVGSFMAYMFEAQPVTCLVEFPSSLVFDPASYSVYAVYQEVEIHPTITEFSSCSIQPALPAGLTLNAATCTVHGKATTGVASTTYTMTSVMGSRTTSGTFTLETVECAGVLANVLRVYRGEAYQESFSIKDLATEQVVLSVAANSGQPNYASVESTVCLTGSKYEIAMASSGTAWQSDSFLYVKAILFEDEYEMIARVRFDGVMGTSPERIVFGRWEVAPHSQWFYKMSEVPANWFGSDTSGWSTGAMGSFSGVTNQIQLYKKTFNIAFLTDVSGFVLSLRYLYGCVIYLNGHEVFRNGVEGDVSASSIGLNAYTDVMYRHVSLPVRTMATAETPSVNYLQEGTNTIAIAIVAQTATQTTSYFDCAVRLMGAADSRVFDYSTEDANMYGNPMYIADLFYGYSIAYSTCADNHLTILFKDNRREWISSVDLYLYYQQGSDHPAQFTLKARNSNLEEWTTLKAVTGMQWSLVGEHKKIWLENNKPWNQYRFENFATGNPDSCSWKLGGIDLKADVIPSTIPELSYPSPVVITPGVEMGEVYPTQDYYYDFSVTPALPEGLSLDANSGKISGTVRELMAATTYQITATKVGGGTTTASVTLSVETCSGTKSLITLVVRTDNWGYEGSYKLYSGKGKGGEVISSLNSFKVSNALNYGDFCVPHGIYTVELCDSANDGWINPAGWYLTVDVGAMIFEMGQVAYSVRSMTSLFSSYLPFQVEYDDWKVWNKDENVAADWKSVDCDEAEWETKKAAEFGNHMGTTAYVRHEVVIPSLEDYFVLNVRMKYAGGVAAYFNGRLVARFNLEENFDASTEATAVHDATLFSKFHVILSTVGAVTGKNVMAFEIHRAVGESALVFDATGVFGVNDCSPVLDTYASIESSTVTDCTKEDLLDLNPVKFGNIPNLAKSFLSWVVENQEGSKFNSFAIQASKAATGYGFSVYGRWYANEEYTSALAVTGQRIEERARNAWAMPVGIAGFSQFKFEVDYTASTIISTNAYFGQYCKPSGSGSCPGVDEYPAVGEGEISPAKCPEGFRGYAYRECANGQLGDVKTDKCEYKLPDKIRYPSIVMEFVMDTEVSSGAPTYVNIIEEFYMQESTPLPEGLKIDAVTGEISGIPRTIVDSTTYVVRGKNQKGETFAEISIRVRKGLCLPEGVFERTEVGETAVYQCSKQGSYFGTQKRACVLGKKDGEWAEATGSCVAILSIVAILVIVIIVVAVVVLIVMKKTRKTKKAVGGVKGAAAKKAVKPAKV